MRAALYLTFLLLCCSADGRAQIQERVLIKNLDTGQVVASKKHRELFPPMAGEKAVYAAAAMELLGPAFRFGTLYNVRGTLSNGILRGNLVVEGHGDPSIDEARLARVAERIRDLGIERITGGILLNDVYYLPPGPEDQGVPLLTEEAPKKFPGPWFPTKALQLDSQKIKVSAYHLGRNDPEISIEPRGTNIPITSYIENGAFQRRIRGVAYSAPGASPILVLGGAVATQQQRAFGIEDSTFLLGQVLYSELQRIGVRSPYRITTQLFSDKHKWLFTDVSPELSTLMTQYLHTEGLEEREFTEAVIRRLGHDDQEYLGTGSLPYGLDVVKTFLTRSAGIRLDGAVLDPTLSGRSRFSAAQLVQLLTYMQKRFEVSAEFTRAIGQARTHRQLVARGLSERVLRNTKVIVDVSQDAAMLMGYAEDAQGRPVVFAASWTGGTPSQLVAAQNRFLEGLVD